jgi:DNA topoisomerase IA
MDINGEHVGLITYMRTDSTRLSEDFYYEHAKPFILEKFGPDYLGYIKDRQEERFGSRRPRSHPSDRHPPDAGSRRPLRRTRRSQTLSFDL